MSVYNEKICLIGFGHHSKRIYYKFIEQKALKGELEFTAIVDLKLQETQIKSFLASRDVKPKHLILAETEGQYTPSEMDESVRYQLQDLIDKGKITIAIIGTEPKAHKIYIEFFIKNRIPVLTDKPITAPVGVIKKVGRAEEVYKDALYLSDLSKQYQTPIYVQVQRREHPAYQFIFNYASQLVQELNVPITYFDIFHCDGSWNMPNEYFERENHPYKYGYGKLMHSGYHFVDLVARIGEVNSLISKEISVSNQTQMLLPGTHYDQIGGKNIYQNLFNELTTKPEDQNLGELDTYSTFNLIDKQTNRYLTYGNLNLLQSGYSRRKHYQLPQDTYKGNGRVRHERFVINIGSFCSIQLHSYQADEVNKAYKQGIGGEEHLEVCIFRNSHLIGGETFEKIDFGSQINREHTNNTSYIGQNELARLTIFEQFLKRQDGQTLIEKQLFTNQLISSIYLSYIKKSQCTVNYVSNI